MTNKKIAILGNMNNSYYALARYMRDAGYDVTLFIFKGEPKHFSPVCDSFSEEYRSFTVFLKWGMLYDLFHTSADVIKKQFAIYDFFIGSGYAPAYLNKGGITLDLFFVYGWDLYQAPFFRVHHPLRTFNFFHSLFHQRAGIQKARHMTVGDPSLFYDTILKKLKFKGKRHTFGTPGIYAPDYDPGTIGQYYNLSKTYKAYKKIRDKYDFVIFHNTRQIWKSKIQDVAKKDNDVFFKAVKKAKEKTTASIAVIAFEYGMDYKSSQELCHTLAIDKDVYWMPLSPRKELMIGMSLCDLVAGEFKNSWLTYGVVVESMASAKPLMHNRIDSLYSKEDLYPMLNATNELEITNQILYAIANKDIIEKIGWEANAWFKKQIADRTLRELEKLIT